MRVKCCIHKLKNCQAGFTLVELVVAVAIVGILAAMALPVYRVQQAKVRQIEAKTNLMHIHTLQETYFAEHGAYYKGEAPFFWRSLGGQSTKVYGDGVQCNVVNSLGFRLENCSKVRYSYGVFGSGSGSGVFRAHASSGELDYPNLVMPGCERADYWFINESKTLRNIAAPWYSYIEIPPPAIVTCFQ